MMLSLRRALMLTLLTATVLLSAATGSLSAGAPAAPSGESLTRCCEGYHPTCGEAVVKCHDTAAARERFMCCPEGTSMVVDGGTCECWCRTPAGSTAAVASACGSPEAAETQLPPPDVGIWPLMPARISAQAVEAVRRRVRGLGAQDLLTAGSNDGSATNDASLVEVPAGWPRWVDAYGLDQYDPAEVAVDAGAPWQIDAAEWPLGMATEATSSGDLANDAAECFKIRNGLAYGETTLRELDISPRRWGWLLQVQPGAALEVPVYAGAFFNDIRRGWDVPVPHGERS